MAKARTASAARVTPEAAPRRLVDVKEAPPGASGIVQERRDDDKRLPEPMDVEQPRCTYFRDGREGTDRWGTPYKDKQACGTGWNEDEGEYVCPLYVEESCPGCKNKGNRVHPCYSQNCTLECGSCGGGGELADTMAYCGQEKGRSFSRGVIEDFGGTLRLDKLMAPKHQHEGRIDLGVTYIPIVEWGGRPWMKALLSGSEGTWTSGYDDPCPMLGTTMKTASSGIARPMGKNTPRWPRTTLRDRLGGYQGKLLVNGLTKDDVIDDVWDSRQRVMKWCMDSEVEVMVTPQYSSYPEFQNFMMVWNGNRIFRWYAECMEMGFPHVALDIPPNFHARWILEEYFEFIRRNNVKLISLSYQQFRSRGGLDYRTLWNAKLVNASVDKDVTVIVFGPGTVQRMMAQLKLFEGRNVIFSSVEPFARSVFYELMPSGASAPPGMRKPEVFCRNVEAIRKQADRVFELARGRKPIGQKDSIKHKSTGQRKKRSRRVPLAAADE